VEVSGQNAIENLIMLCGRVPQAIAASNELVLLASLESGFFASVVVQESLA
jgi:hypothetical protein